MEAIITKSNITISEKIFTILVVLMPILQMYSFPGTKILVVDMIFFLLCIMMSLSISKQKISSVIYYPLFILLAYIVFHWLIMWIVNGNSYMKAITPRTIRNIFYLMITIFFIKSKFNIELALKVLKYISIFATIYIIIQTILVKYFNYYLPGTLPFFDTVVDQFNDEIINSGLAFRPRSIFSEPATYADFIGKYLIVDLFLHKKNRVKEYMPSVFVSIGILLSGSSTGYLLFFLIWILFLTSNFFKKITLKKIIGIQLLVFIIPIFIILMSNTDFFITAYEHFFVNKSYLGRIKNYGLIFNILKISNFQALFGNGFLPQEFFMPGIPRLFYYFGILGIVIWLIVFLLIWKESAKVSRLLIFLMIITSIFGDALFGISYLYYYPFIIGLNSYMRPEYTDIRNDSNQNSKL